MFQRILEMIRLIDRYARDDFCLVFYRIGQSFVLHSCVTFLIFKKHYL